MEEIVTVSHSEENEKRLKNAQVFLRNPSVRSSPLSRKVAFLKSKGLTAKDIHDCFVAVGDSETSLETIATLWSSKSNEQRQRHVDNTPQQAISLATQPAPLPHHDARLVTSEESSWKDYFIGATLFTLSLFAGYHAFQRYSPYELVPKSAKKSVQKRNRQIDIPLPAQPSTATESLKNDTELLSLRQEVSEKGEQLAKSRRENATLAAANGKLKGDVQRLTRSLEKLQQSESTISPAPVETAPVETKET